MAYIINCMLYFMLDEITHACHQFIKSPLELNHGSVAKPYLFISISRHLVSVLRACENMGIIYIYIYYPWNLFLFISVISVQAMTCANTRIHSQITRFIGTTWGPPGSCRPQMGPMLAPRTLLSVLRPGSSICLHITYRSIIIIQIYLKALNILIWVGIFCRVCQFSQLSFMQYMRLCVFSLSISLLMTVRICALYQTSPNWTYEPFAIV